MQFTIVFDPMQNNNIRTDLPTYFILVLENTINSWLKALGDFVSKCCPSKVTFIHFEFGMDNIKVYL